MSEIKKMFRLELFTQCGNKENKIVKAIQNFYFKTYLMSPWKRLAFISNNRKQQQIKLF